MNLSITAVCVSVLPACCIPFKSSDADKENTFGSSWLNVA